MFEIVRECSGGFGMFEMFGMFAMFGLEEPGLIAMFENVLLRIESAAAERVGLADSRLTFQTTAGLTTSMVN